MPSWQLLLCIFICPYAAAAPTLGSVTEISSFSIPKSPSGMYFNEDQNLLYILCGTRTNSEHTLYAYTTAGAEKCEIIIPEAVGMSRVDGFYIVGSSAYIVDSQGPIYADAAGRLGGSVYQVEWTNPCGCADAACTSSTVTWSPTVTKTWSIAATDASIGDGGGTDENFRNSGIVIAGDHFYGVNGVHTISGSLTNSYPKSIVKVSLSAQEIGEGNAPAVEKWSFDGSTLGHDVDMEGLTCGADNCASTLYIGDEYNYIYKLDLSSGAVTMEWDLSSIVGSVPADQGIESITFASTTGYFYAGIQDTQEIHVVSLSETPATDDEEDDDNRDGQVPTNAECTPTDDYPACDAPTVTTQRVRREIRQLTTAEWDKVVAAMWVMKTQSMADGQAAYGAAFRPYDYFVVKHAVATTDTRGDQAHSGSHFITWHMAFVLEFEEAMLAVDPSIGALPYWDQTITSPSAFTDDYFGADPTEATAFQVTTGPFANWPVVANFDIADYLPYMDDDSTVAFVGNSEGWLRDASNSGTNEFSTRYGGGATWESRAVTLDEWWRCTTDEANALWNDWYLCIESGSISIHSDPHSTIGGTSGGAAGDFKDLTTSPNGPIFMFHHANMDRSKMWWMRKHADENCEYYGFPLTDASIIIPPSQGGGGGGGGGMGGGMGPPQRRTFFGAHLNEVVASAWGFTGADLGLTNGPAGQLTHADLICWVGPDTAAYTYDTHADCLKDPAKCHAVQGVLTTTDDGTSDGEEEEGNDQDSDDEDEDESEEQTGEVETFTLQVSTTLGGVTAEQLRSNLAGFRSAVASLHGGVSSDAVVVDEASIADVEVRRALGRRLLAAGVAVAYEIRGFADTAAAAAAKSVQEAGAAALETSLKAEGFDSVASVTSAVSLVNNNGEAVQPTTSDAPHVVRSAWIVVAAVLAVAQAVVM